MSQVTVIEIETRVKDDTASGVASAQKNLSKLEQSFLKMQSAFTALSKGSFVEVVATLEDQVSPFLDGISSLGEGLSGTAYGVTLDCVDRITSPLSALEERLSSPFTALVEVATEVLGGEGLGGATMSNMSGTSALSSASNTSTSGERSPLLSTGVLTSEVVHESSWVESVQSLQSLVETVGQGVSTSLTEMFSKISSSAISSEKDSVSVTPSSVSGGSGVSPLLSPSVTTGQMSSGLSSHSLTTEETSLYGMNQSTESSLQSSSEVLSSFSSLVVEQMERLSSDMAGVSQVSQVAQMSPVSQMSQNEVLNTSQSSLTEHSISSGGVSNWNQMFSLGSVSGALLGQNVSTGFGSSDVSGTFGISGISGSSEISRVTGSVLGEGSVSSFQQDSVQETIATDSVSSVSQGFSTFFGETVPVKLEEFCTHLEESVSSSLVLAQEPVSALFQGFFTENVPSVMETFFSAQVTALEEVSSLASETIGEEMGGFWQEELPSFFEGFWTQCSQQLTEGESLALEAVSSGVNLFWSEEVPSLFADFWASTGESFAEGQALALEMVSGGVDWFFGEVIPLSLEELWTKSQSKIEEISLVTQTVLDLGIGTFFGVTIPSSVQYIWDGATATLEGAKVSALATVSSGISGFFASASAGINGFFDTAQSKINAALSTASASVSALSISGGSGTGTSVPAYANGGILSSPHVGLVAEDGPEAIIPLSGKRRSRGLELWEEAGRVLGVTPYAHGGLVGSGMSLLDGGTGDGVPVPSLFSLPSQTTGQQGDGRQEGVTVHLGQVNFNVKMDDCKNPEEVLTLLKEKIGECTQEIALSLAHSLERSFENMPLYPC